MATKETEVTIASRALVALGAKEITTFEGTDRGKAAKLQWETLKPAILAGHDWNFIRAIAQLTRDGTDPPFGWKYRYQLPTDRLSDRIVKLVDSTAEHAPALTDWRIYGEFLHASYETVYVEYLTRDKAVALWPMWFVDFMVVAMQARLAMTITDQANLASELTARAFGPPSENGRGGMYAALRARDSQSDPPEQFQDFTLLNARQGGVP